MVISAMDMINQLVAAQDSHDLLKKLKYYQSPDLLVCDEIGYLPLGKQGSNLFFKVISARHEQKSTIITTNLPFAQWGNIFDSTSISPNITFAQVTQWDIRSLQYKKQLIQDFRGRSYGLSSFQGSEFSLFKQSPQIRKRFMWRITGLNIRRILQ